MSDHLATVYSFGFHDPKPLHPIVVANWATISSAKFVLLTDRADLWTSLLPPGTTNIFIHQIDIEKLFERSFPIFEVDSFTEFRSKRSYLFNRVLFEMNGYLGCQLRPILSVLLPQRRTKFWGWIDNDVLVSASELQSHLATVDTDLVLYPEVGLMWEQFKLYSSEINTMFWYKDLVDYFIELNEPPVAPLEAKFVYHMKDMRRFRHDGIDQTQAAIHWAYSDRVAAERGPLPNIYDVILNRDMSIQGVDGQRPIFFNCDNQVKLFKKPEVAEVNAALSSDGQYTFVHTPWL